MNNKLINWGLFILLSLIWGSSFKLMKMGLVSLSPYQVAALRMISAGIVLLPFAFKAVKSVSTRQFYWIILSGMLGSFFPAFLFCIAETKIDSSLAGILNALTPLFTIVIGVFFLKITVRPLQFLGVITGFAGLVLLFLLKGNITLTYLYFSLLVLLATIFYAFNVNLVYRHLQQVASLNIASIAFGFLIIPSALILWASGYFSLPLFQKEYLTTSIYSVLLGVFGTAIASILFYMLVKRAGGLFASMVTYGIPFVALFWGLLSGETINGFQVVCLGIILFGVYLANKKPATKDLQV